jgi:hypothetical protein
MLRFGWYVFSREERRLPTHEEAEWPGSPRRWQGVVTVVYADGP